MFADAELAILSSEAYKDPNPNLPNMGYSLPQGVSVFATSGNSDDDEGYFGIAFKKGGEIVVVNRGTEPDSFLDFFQDLDDDISIAVDMPIFFENIPQQHARAQDFVNTVHSMISAGENVIYSGHSLGAVLAELNAAEHNARAVTFDSPGSRPVIQGLIENGTLPSSALINADSNVLTYNSRPNAINTTNEHVGFNLQLDIAPEITAISLIAPYLDFTLQQHSRENFVNAFDHQTGQLIVGSTILGPWPTRGYGSFVDYTLNQAYWDLRIEDAGYSAAQRDFIIATYLLPGGSVFGRVSEFAVDLANITGEGFDLLSSLVRNFITPPEGNFTIQQTIALDNLALRHGYTTEELLNLPGNEILASRILTDESTGLNFVVYGEHEVVFTSLADANGYRDFAILANGFLIYDSEFDSPDVINEELLEALGVYMEAADSPPAVGDPLILDLDGDGLELIAVENSNTFFDLDGNGTRERSGWVHPDDALLVLDRNGNGIIDDVTELFGSETTSGFVELAELDSNGDGFVDEEDESFADLLLWQDFNGNGFSDNGEIRSILSSNIVSFDLGEVPISSVQDRLNEGNLVVGFSSYSYADGRLGNFYEVYFSIDPVNSDIADFTLPEQDNGEPDFSAFFLPLSRGYGSLAPWHVAMSLDAELLEMMREIVEVGLDSLDAFNARVEEFLYRWSGVESVDPISRGIFVDARRLEFLEAFNDAAFFQNLAESSDPDFFAAQLLNQSWDTIFNNFANRILQQSVFGEVLGSVYDFSSDEIVFNNSLAEILDNLEDQSYSTDNVSGEYFWLQLVKYLDTGRDRFAAEYTDAEVGDILVSLLESAFDLGSSSAASLLAIISDLDITPGANIGVGSIAFGGSSSYIGGSDSNDTLISSFGGTGFLRGGQGDDVLLGGVAENILDGGADNDELYGSSGNDVYVYRLGGGSDNIYDTGGLDVIELHNISASEVSYMRSSNNLIIAFNDGGSITINNYYLTAGKIEELVFVNGNNIEKIDLAQIALTIVLEGTESGDILFGGDFADQIDGGAGNDELYGGAGDDSYIYSLGGGSNVIVESGNDQADSISLGVGIDIDDLRFSEGANGDLHIGVAEHDDAIILRGHFAAQQNESVEFLRFADGFKLRLDELVSGGYVFEDDAQEDTAYSISQSQLLGSLGAIGAGYSLDSVSIASNGNVQIVDDNVIFIPNINFNGVASFDVTLIDDKGQKLTIGYNLNVLPAGDAPTQINLDNLSIDQLTFGAVVGNLTSDDVDVGDIHSYNVDDARFEVVDGQIKLLDDSLVDFALEPSITINITSTDIYGLSHTQEFTIDVNNQNVAPASREENFTLNEDSAIELNIADLVIDRNGDALTIISVGQASNGSVSFNENSITYTPNANYNGVDSFQYEVTDGFATSILGVNLNVSPVDDRPVAVDDHLEVVSGADLIIDGLTLNDFDVDNGRFFSLVPITAMFTENGTLENINGIYVYRANDGFVGTDSFTYQIADRLGRTSDFATVHIDILPPSDITFFALQQIAQTIPLSYFPENADLDSFTVSLVDGSPLPGWLSFDAASLTFSGVAPFYALDSFDIIVDYDDGVASSSFEFTLNIAYDPQSYSLQRGSDGDDIISTIFGSETHEYIDAGAGNDEIFFSSFGGESSDVAVGGLGDDRFVLAQEGNIVIRDFEYDNPNEVISLSAVLDQFAPSLVLLPHVRSIFDLDITLDGSDTIIDFTNHTVKGDSLTLRLVNVRPEQLRTESFDLTTLITGSEGGDTILAGDQSGATRFLYFHEIANQQYSSTQGFAAMQQIGVVRYEAEGFDASTEVIYLSDIFASSYDDIIVTQQGDDTQIELANGELIILRNIEPSAISEANFTFDIEASAINNIIETGAGNDTIHAGAGDDIINGGAGDDIIYAGAGDDVIDGGQGRDIIFLDDGNDTVSVDSDDTIIVGRSANSLQIIQSSNLGTPAAFNSINLAGLSDVVSDFATLLSRATELGFSNVLHSFPGVAVDLGQGQTLFIEWFTIADLREELFSFTSFVLPNFVTGTEGDDILVASAEAESFDGREGVDIVSYRDSSSAVQVNLQDGTGQGAFAQGDFYANINGVQGSAHDDNITGDDSDNILEGAAGDDVLAGGNGVDSYIYNLGDGHDTINDSSVDRFGGLVSRQNVVNQIIFGEAIAEADIIVSTVFSEQGELFEGVRVEFAGNSLDSLFLANLDGDYDLVFADGSVSSLQDKITPTQRLGTQGNDFIVGTDILEHILGLGGDDQINGSGSNDILEGGTGNDSLSGGNGNDSYIYNIGDGHDIISDVGGRIIFGDAILAEDLTLSLNITGPAQAPSYSGITIGFVNDPTGSIVLNFFTDYILEFSDGTILELEGDDAPLFDIVGTDENDFIFGKSLNERIIGGTGDDLLDGSLGNDVYVYNLGDGDDTISDFHGIDTIEFGEGISLQDLAFFVSSSNLTISVMGQSTIDILGHFTENHGIEQLFFASGQIVNLADHINLVEGDSTSEHLYGTDGNDIILAGAGNDVVKGQLGADTLDGGAGYDVAAYWQSLFGINIDLLSGVGSGGEAEGDILSSIEGVYGSAHNDNLFGTNGTNTLYGEGGDDRIEGRAGNDTIRGDSGRDILYGGSGNDTISGGSGNDLLKGDSGSDILNGGSGYDIAAYWRSSSGVSVDLLRGVGSGGEAEGDILSSIEGVYGSAHNDSLTGTSGTNTLYGGAGDDRIEGGAGRDTLRGDEGRDIFVFSSLNDSTNSLTDRINDFTQGEDVLDLSALGIAFDNIAISAQNGLTTIGLNDNFSVELLGEFSLTQQDFLL